MHGNHVHVHGNHARVHGSHVHVHGNRMSRCMARIPQATLKRVKDSHSIRELQGMKADEGTSRI